MKTPLLCAVLCWVFTPVAFGLPRLTPQTAPALSVPGMGENQTNHLAATPTNPPMFTRISDPAISVSSCTAIAWGDYNNDGFVDLFVGPFNRASLLFSNNGNGTFTRVLGASVVADSGATFGAGWADYDNDGWLDLFVGVNNQGNDWLYHNNGGGSFTKIASGAIVSSGGNANNCAWGDYDNDGWVDLFVANSDQNDFLFSNRGDGSFVRITTNAIALKAGNSQGGSWGDYDNDGLLDLFVSRVNEPNLLYHNQGGGAFVPVTNDAIVRDVSVGQGTSWGDYDNDGYLDLFVANPGNGKNFLYRNNGNGSFTRITNGAIANDLGMSSSGAWGDYDNDGFLDLFVANRSGFDFLYHNNGEGTFTRVTNSILTRDPAASFSAAWADFDNDGFLDLFVTRYQTYNNALYHNAGNGNAWIILKCEGRLSNRAAIGAKVRVQAFIAGREVWQLREVSGGGGLGAQPDLRPHFGLGDATKVERIRIEWPSGLVQELFDVHVRQLLTVVEPDTRISPPTQQVPAGSTARFSLATTLPDPLSWQWQLNGVALPGETNATLLVTNVQARDLGIYTVRVTSAEPGFVFTTPAATLRGAVSILQQPLSQNVWPGSNAMLTVVASGLEPLHYQWQLNGTNLPFATRDTLTLTNVQFAQNGSYTVAVSNSYGLILSSKVNLTVLLKPVITLQPLSQTVVDGGSVTFSISAEGNPPTFGYRWRKNGIAVTNLILNDTTCYFTVTNVKSVSTNMVLTYTVAVTNSAGGVLSSAAVLTVLADTDLDGLPDDWETAVGLSATNAEDAALDTDGDGLSNLQEFLAGTNPNDPQSLLRIEDGSQNPDRSFSLRFMAVSNNTYTVQAWPCIAGAPWTRVADVPAAPTNRTIVLNVPAEAGPSGQRLYRVTTPRVP